MQDAQTAHAREVLREHRPFDALERQHLGKILALLDRDAPVTQRDCFEPGHLTASGFVLSPDREKVLLIEHARLGRWLQPGGHLEAHDRTLREAAIREVFEETGLTGLITDEDLGGLFDVDVHLIPALGSEPEHFHYDLRYVFVAPQEEVVAGPGIRGARFWPLAGIETRFDLPSLHRPLLKIRRATHGLYAREAAE